MACLTVDDSPGCLPIKCCEAAVGLCHGKSRGRQSELTMAINGMTTILRPSCSLSLSDETKVPLPSGLHNPLTFCTYLLTRSLSVISDINSAVVSAARSGSRLSIGGSSVWLIGNVRPRRGLRFWSAIFPSVLRMASTAKGAHTLLSIARLLSGLRCATAMPAAVRSITSGSSIIVAVCGNVFVVVCTNSYMACNQKAPRRCGAFCNKVRMSRLR